MEDESAFLIQNEMQPFPTENDGRARSGLWGVRTPGWWSGYLTGGWIVCMPGACVSTVAEWRVFEIDAAAVKTVRETVTEKDIHRKAGQNQCSATGYP